MVCPRCGSLTSTEASRCQRCGALFAHGSVATIDPLADTTGLSSADTTGMPPVDTCGPTIGLTEGLARAGFGDDRPATPGATPSVGRSFGPRYHITKVLGVGGMGAVYQAWDAELGLAVALKVIRGAERHRASSEVEQ